MSTTPPPQQGSITEMKTLTAVDNDTRTGPVQQRGRARQQRQPVHLYLLAAEATNRERGLFNHLAECFNVAEFKMRHNEEHLVVTDLTPSIYQALLDEDDVNAPILINSRHSPFHLGYRVRVIPRNTVVTVGSDTKLDLLLRLPELEVYPLMLSISQMIQLLTPTPQ
jgi:hypothetical protein